MKTKAPAIFYILLALMMPLTYGLFQEFFFEILYSFPIAKTDIFYEYVQDNPFFTDALFCVVAFLIYLGMYQILLLVTRKHRQKEEEASIAAQEEAKLGVLAPHGWKPIRKKFTIWSLLFCLIVALGLGGISTIWLNFADGLGDSLLSESLDEFANTFAYDPDVEDYIWPFLSIVLLGPIIEEILFRGLMFHFALRVRRRWFPILLTGIVFGLWHVIPVQVVYTAFMGIGLGIVYYATGNLWFPIWIHVINNFFSRLPPAIDQPEVWALIEIGQNLMIVPTIIILLYQLIHTNPKQQARLVMEKHRTALELEKAQQEIDGEENQKEG